MYLFAMCALTILRFWCISVLTGGLALLLAEPAAAQSRGTPVHGTPIEKHEIIDPGGRRITYYISRPAKPAPLMLMIQGSGCERVINIAGTGSYSSLYNFIPYAAQGRFTVMAVEKPYSGPVGDVSRGSARSCSAEFHADFTAESWLAALEASVADARRLPWVDGRRTLLFGTSEGAVMASLLAARDKKVTDVVVIGGSGTTQLFDFLAFAYQRCFDRSECIAEVERQVRAIAAAPQSSTQFAWGHPYKRWTSFFGVDPAGALLRSRARVYVAFGTADASVPPISQELIVARLMAAARDVTVRRVPNGSHGLTSAGAKDWTEVDREYGQALDWFWRVPLP
jgi:pimeloyl-ACP methyl ester carboxylesterase